MRTRRWIVALLTGGALLALPAATAGKGAHGEKWTGATPETCPSFTTEARFKSTDESISGAVELLNDGLYEASDRLDSVAFKQTASLTLLAAQVANFAVRSQNVLAEATCYTPRHWQLEDELMKMTIQADLASTTTPDLSFVMPEERPTEHVPPVRKETPGYIDRHRDGSDNPNEIADADIIGVRSSVRDVIDQMKAAEQCTCSLADQYHDQAVAAMDSGSYKAAYKLFRQAYVYAFSN
jgi:hypothetical protein